MAAARTVAPLWAAEHSKYDADRINMLVQKGLN